MSKPHWSGPEEPVRSSTERLPPDTLIAEGPESADRDEVSGHESADIAELRRQIETLTQERDHERAQRMTLENRLALADTDRDEAWAELKMIRADRDRLLRPVNARIAEALGWDVFPDPHPDREGGWLMRRGGETRSVPDFVGRLATEERFDPLETEVLLRADNVGLDVGPDHGSFRLVADGAAKIKAVKRGDALRTSIEFDAVAIRIRPEGRTAKLRVNAGSWDGVRVILADQDLQLVAEGGQVQVERRGRGQ